MKERAGSQELDGKPEDADNALAFMVQIRWPNGIFCPRCESTEHSFISTRRVWKCKGCKKQFTVKLGTIMEDSPIGFDKWLAAIWMIANDKNGISSYEIHRGLGITQKSAWFLLHRIRLAMQTGTFEKLAGPVEADETFIGGKASNMHELKREQKIQGRGGVGKTIVMGILERHGEVRAQVVPDREGDTLQGIVREHVKAGASVYTDSLTSYAGLSADYVHDFVNHTEEYVRGAVHTNGIENFWSLLKRGLKGTYVSVEPFHLFRYVDEQSFRFNNRKTNDAERFLKTCRSISGRRVTYKKLTGKTLMRDAGCVKHSALEKLRDPPKFFCHPISNFDPVSLNGDLIHGGFISGNSIRRSDSITTHMGKVFTAAIAHSQFRRCGTCPRARTL